MSAVESPRLRRANARSRPSFRKVCVTGNGIELLSDICRSVNYSRQNVDFCLVWVTQSLMQPETAARASLCAVLRHDLDALRRMDQELAALVPALAGERASFRDTAAAGYLLHNIYNALENSIEQISRTFENHVVDVSRWHRELLGKMFLEIPGVRPPVLPERLRPLLQDLCGFRQVFRHSYDFHLDSSRVFRLASDWDMGKEELFAALSRFGDWLLSGSTAGSSAG